jgi:hypothetical protein
MKPTLSAAAQAELANIAQANLSIETLETRNSDRLDFHEVAVASLKAALEAAYLAGMVASGHHGIPGGR